MTVQPQSSTKTRASFPRLCAKVVATSHVSGLLDSGDLCMAAGTTVDQLIRPTQSATADARRRHWSAVCARRWACAPKIADVASTPPSSSCPLRGCLRHLHAAQLEVDLAAAVPSANSHHPRRGCRDRDHRHASASARNNRCSREPLGVLEKPELLRVLEGLRGALGVLERKPRHGRSSGRQGRRSPRRKVQRAKHPWRWTPVGRRFAGGRLSQFPPRQPRPSALACSARCRLGRQSSARR